MRPGTKSIRFGHAITWAWLKPRIAARNQPIRSTIGVSLMLGISREEAARFSFLMVLIPIGGATLIEIIELSKASNLQSISQVQWAGYAVGTLAAFFSGLMACTWMIRLVKKSNLTFFAIYCLFIGVLAFILH